MLKNLHPLLSPPLLTVLAEMGHGDEIAIVDANFPAASHARRLVQAGGSTAPQVLEAVLTLLPLDSFVACPAAVMTPQEGRPPIIGEFQVLLDAAESTSVGIEDVDQTDAVKLTGPSISAGLAEDTSASVGVDFVTVRDTVLVVVE